MFIQLNFLLTNVFIAAFVNNVWTKQQTILIRTRGLYRLKIKFRIIVYRGHPYSTYAQKSPQLDPPHPLYKIVRIWIQFISGSSLRHSQFLDYFHFYLSLRLIFTKSISKTPLPPCTQSYALGLTTPLPLCVYVLCGWPHNVLNIFFKHFFTLHT